MRGWNEYWSEHILVYFQYAKNSRSPQTVTHENLDLHIFLKICWEYVLQKSAKEEGIKGKDVKYRICLTHRLNQLSHWLVTDAKVKRQRLQQIVNQAIFVENRKTKLLIQRALKNNEIYDVSAFSEGFQAMGSSFKRLVLRRPRYKVVISWPSIPFASCLFQVKGFFTLGC